MSGVSRLLAWKDRRDPKVLEKAIISYGDLGSIFVPEPLPSKKKADKEEEKKVKAIHAKLMVYGAKEITNSNIEYALRLPSTAGSADEAYRLCRLLDDTYSGIITTYNPGTKLLGAVNRQGVTCYLDALLFAMFARLDGFEGILLKSLEDPPRKKLAGLLRLWVNMLRSGRLITVDITQNLQAALAECGWEAANKLEQQDASEAFAFITGQLELPLLTLKMDLYHTGKEDPEDDHKFVNERLLEVAILDKPVEGQSDITLEDCLENYFNNRVEVKRHMARQRRQSFQRSHEGLAGYITDEITDENAQQPVTMEKLPDLHIESIELTERPDPPPAQTPSADGSTPEALPKKGPLQQLRPTVGRTRADSIFSQKRVKTLGPGSGPEPKAADDTVSIHSDHTKKTKASARTEVLMPAWQFFKLLPWYTDNMPTSDAQVAAHFALKRPILGICLKRYMVNNEGVCSRLDTYVDIPLEIAVPEFVSDDSMEDGSPLVGNFKLVLQSVVCHRGTSLHSGHYVSLVRGHAANAVPATSPDLRPSSSDSRSDDGEDTWMLFDDLAEERVRYVDIVSALKSECPYLLFYQVRPIDDETGPPSYDEATSRTNSPPLVPIDEKLLPPDYYDYDVVLVEQEPPAAANGAPLEQTSPGVAEHKSYISNTEPPSRSSMDIIANRISRTSTSSDRRRSVTLEDNPNSVVFVPSVPTTPSEESRLSFLNLPSRHSSRQGGRKSKSRPTSMGASDNNTTTTTTNNRFSLNVSRLTTRLSKSELPSVLSAGSTPTTPQLSDQLDTAAASLTKDVEEGKTGDAETQPDTVEPTTTTTTSIKKKKGKDKDVPGEEKAEKKKKWKKSEVPERDCKVM